MAVPSISNIYPAAAHAGGEAVIRILGGGFKAPQDPTVEYVERGEVVPTVEVLFGDQVATAVTVVNHALMYVVAPVSPLDTGAGTVSVTVRNIDANGDVIGAETVTAAAAFTYQAVKLTDESDLSRLIRALIREMKRQIIPEVVYSPHTDYDADTGDQLNIVSTATLPSLALIGPMLEESRFYSVNTLAYVGGHGHQVRRRAPYTVDVKFSVLGLANKSVQAVNLQSAVIRFFDRNRTIRMLTDATDATAGWTSYEMSMDRTGAPGILGFGDDANVRSFEARIVIRGFNVETLAGFNSLNDGAIGITSTITDDDDSVVIGSTEQLLP